MRKRLLFLPLITTVVLMSGCASSSTVEETHPEGYVDVSTFEKKDDTRFALYLPEKGFIDISEYVLDYAESKVMVSDKIINGVFDMTQMNRDNSQDETVFIEYDDEDGNLLQLQENGTGIVYNGNVLNSAEPLEKDGDSLKISLTDLIFAMGYQKMDQSVLGDIFFVTVYKSFDDPTVTIPIFSGDEIEDIAELNFMSIATSSDAAPESETEIDETVEQVPVEPEFSGETVTETEELTEDVSYIVEETTEGAEDAQ